MVASTSVALQGASLEKLQSRFLSILPRIKLHARIYFRHVKCGVKKADFIAEVVALSWKWFLRLHEQGKDATHFPSVLASFAARAVRSGRRVCGQLKAKDVLSERAQQIHSFTVGKLPDFSTESTNPLAEALADNTKTPPPDAAAFRCDFPAWKRTRTQRDRKIINRMMHGDRTKELAANFGLSPARISQLRRQYHDDWQQFTDDRTTVVS